MCNYGHDIQQYHREPQQCIAYDTEVILEKAIIDEIPLPLQHESLLSRSAMRRVGHLLGAHELGLRVGCLVELDPEIDNRRIWIVKHPPLRAEGQGLPISSTIFKSSGSPNNQLNEENAQLFTQNWLQSMGPNLR